MNTNLTPKEIFAANQVLTLEKAKTLIGKTIAVTNREYKANSPHVRTGKFLSIESEWDLASKEDLSHAFNGKWATRQDYWASYMTEKEVKRMKERLVLVSNENRCGVCELDNSYFSEPTFFGSDADREIYYVIIND